MKAAIYSRYSSDQQRATSIEDQVRNCLRRVQAEGWTDSARFADAVITGSDANRPEYQRMLAAAMGGEFQVLLVDDLSRLARDSIEQEKSIRRLEFQGVRIIAVSDGYDSQSKARKVHRGFKGLMNEIFLDDLREKVHRGLEGQAIKGRWTGGRVYGYRLRPIVDETRRDAYGNPERIGTMLEVDAKQAPVVRWMFERYAEGASCGRIAAELNERGIPSPGSTWRRQVRRCGGWMASAVRQIIANQRYTGRQYWNRSQYLKDPDNGKDRRRARPESEWTVQQDESLRIISGDLFERSRIRTRASANSDERLRSGGRVKYLLSGLLVCEKCGANYVLHDVHSYACSSYRYGRACTNSVHVRRNAAEQKILAPVRDELLSPARVEKMAKEMERYYAEQVKARQAKATELPRELQDLTAR